MYWIPTYLMELLTIAITIVNSRYFYMETGFVDAATAATARASPALRRCEWHGCRAPRLLQPMRAADRAAGAPDIST